jgi:hypothetical protein
MFLTGENAKENGYAGRNGSSYRCSRWRVEVVLVLRLARAGGLREGVYTVYRLVHIGSFHRLPFQKIFIQYLCSRLSTLFILDRFIFHFEIELIVLNSNKGYISITRIYQLLSDHLHPGILFNETIPSQKRHRNGTNTFQRPLQRPIQGFLKRHQ